MNLTKEEVTEIGDSIKVEYASLMAFIMVESGGIGFDPVTGKIIIQFEPAHFNQYVKTRKPGDAAKWEIIDHNKVEGQKAEWIAFNAAFLINPQAALECTSIGLMQVMGWNYALCGFKTVNEMWDAFKTGSSAQIKGAAMFIKNSPKLYMALQNKDWPKVAYYYNGSNYVINKYDIRLEKAYHNYAV